ncbi:hypothetical protein HMPREF0495_01318 [Levilactobacillus brevis ATCC 14869 = DSM 20054]|uniref:Uncharacterized protein n=1 Tax=Levilactobacillus brevis ATCC 14869 = DSM 20054 TaxID=649758 RepID=U2P054_LEVBR|nr:hypothetical protein HMPREF0495_01318 [Levilactobacillus brevis ATCC 14869 = DSM 20054]
MISGNDLPQESGGTSVNYGRYGDRLISFFVNKIKISGLIIGDRH